MNIACKGRTVALDNKWNSGQACGKSAAPVIDHFVTYADFWKNPNCRSWQTMKGRLAHYWATKEEKEPV